MSKVTSSSADHQTIPTSFELYCSHLSFAHKRGEDVHACETDALLQGFQFRFLGLMLPKGFPHSFSIKTCLA